MLPIILLLNFETVYELVKKKQVESQLKEVNEHFNTVIENVQLIVVGIDLKGKINYSNPYFIQLSEYSRDELIGKEFIPFFIPDGTVEELQNVFQKLLKGENYPRYETQILTRKKEIRFIAWSNVLLHDSKGKLQGVLSVGADITERMQSRDKLIRAYKDIEEIKIKLEDENSYLKETINNPDKKQSLLIGDSDTMNYVRKSIKEVASTDSIVLIEGETGVGKELVAQAIYDESIRNSNPFIKVNCGALPKELIESELFGHEKGAFTGAINARKGRFELADGGTIFLDEIGELPLELQPRLLRVLQSGEFEKLGSEKTTKVNVRILTATNKNLKKCADEGSFREDLYYRLSVFPITVPPLRKRKEDIPDLVYYFVKEFCKKNGKTKLRIAISTIKKLQCYNWPGNIRELRNVLERAVITSNTDKLMIRDKLENINADELSSKYVSLEEIEKHHITKVLSDCNWKVSGANGAATVLDLNEGTLRSKMKKLGITREKQSSSLN